ncbi:MAG TPA: UvrD-helicase domain-containing protein [Acidimicrobiales bacterium]|nr:UvrD-helicase domain-containing protein [Acidimicrobiales bacterium]
MIATPAPLADAAARQRIVDDLDCELAVDAAAGSGKTTVLVQRVVSLVRSKRVPMRAIAAITFTEAAAAELRTRLRVALTDAGRTDPDLASAVHEVDEAAVSTIHAFARRILVEHWLSAGLPPRVDVLDAPAEQIEQRVRWREFTNELLADPDAGPMLVRAFATGLRLSNLPEVAGALSSQHHRLDDRVRSALAAERLLRADPPVDLGPLVVALDDALAYLPHCTDDRDALLAHLQSAVDTARRRILRLAPGDDVTALSVLDDLAKLSCANGKANSWTCPVQDVRDQCQAAEDVRNKILAEVRQSVTADLLWRMAEWAVRCARQRHDEGRLTFHDLLVETCRLLRDDANVRRAVRARYRCLLIDEFQDTDPLQVELAELLRTAPHDPAEETGPARLFVVGDPEQSIYRFRGADLALFIDTVDALEDRLELASNFRSVPGVLDWVDELFGRSDWDGGNGPGTVHRALSAVRDAPDQRGHPSVVLYGDASRVPASQVRQLGAEETAQLMRRVVDEAWLVQEPSAKAVTPRPVRFGDVAILIPTRTSLPALERALEDAAVPYRLEGVSLVWAAQEVRDLLAILRAAEDPADAVAVVAALRTAALACGDDDLVRFHSEATSWDPRGLTDAVDEDDRVVRAMRLLAELHARRMWLEPSQLVSLVLERLHLFDLALVHERPRDHWQRLRWVLDQARAFDEAIGGTLGDFLTWIDLRQDEGWSSSLGPPEPDDDAVRVLTIHGAKGLEFPVVFLTGLEGFDRGHPAARVLWDDAGVPRVRIVREFASPGYEALADTDKDLDGDERRRLLYVAMTRARDHLLVDVSRKDQTGSLLIRLAAACQEFPAAWCRPPQPVERPSLSLAASVEPSRAGPADGAAAHARWVAQRRATLAAGARQPAWSATALSERPGGLALEAEVHSTRDPSQGRDEEPAGRLAPPSGEEQRLVGRAVHDTLAKVDLRGWADGPAVEDAGRSEALRLLAETATRAQGLEEARAADVARLARRALGAPTVRALAGVRHFRELPLAAPVEPGNGDAGVIEGFADLVGQLVDGLVVVDFKTFVDRHTRSHATNPEHLRQVAAYAYALRCATGLPVTRAVVCYLFDDGADEVALMGEALDAAIADVLDAARRAAREGLASPSR